MNKSGKTEKSKKAKIIGISVAVIIVAAIVLVAVFSGASQFKVEKVKKQAFDTSSYAEGAKKENDYQFSDSVIEIDSNIFTVDSSKITVRKSGSNKEKTLIEGNIDAGIVTDGKTVYYYDLDTNEIMSLNVENKKTRKVLNVPENVKVDEKTQTDQFIFARFDGMYKDFLYYQVQQGEEYMPNYMVNVKTGKVKKLALTDYGTYKFQIADGKLYFDIFRTMSSPSVLYSADVDGSNVKTLVEGVSNFEVIGDKIYYFKVESVTEKTNKIMFYDIKTGKSELVRDNMEYTSGGFTSYGMISDRMIGNTLHTIIDYYDGTSEALGGNGAKICGEVAIVHAGVPEDITSEDALKQATVPQWYIVGNKSGSELITLPEKTTPANFKDGYIYYYTFTDGGKTVMNRQKVKF